MRTREAAWERNHETLEEASELRESLQRQFGERFFIIHEPIFPRIDGRRVKTWVYAVLSAAQYEKWLTI